MRNETKVFFIIGVLTAILNLIAKDDVIAYIPFMSNETHPNLMDIVSLVIFGGFLLVCHEQHLSATKSLYALFVNNLSSFKLFARIETIIFATSFILGHICVIMLRNLFPQATNFNPFIEHVMVLVAFFASLLSIAKIYPAQTFYSGGGNPPGGGNFQNPNNNYPHF